MAENDSPEPPAAVDLWVVLPRVWKRRGRILALSVAASLIALGVTFVLPKTYRAEASILPPEGSNLFVNLAVGYQSLKKFTQTGMLGEYHTPADVFRGILQSRSVRNEVIQRFDLQKVYRQKSPEKTLRILTKRTKVTLYPDGTITLTVVDRDPRRAADMAAAYIEQLDRVNITQLSIKARRMRAVLERRVHEADSLLRATEHDLERYQRSRHTAVPASFDAGSVQAAADLMARKIALEVRLGVLHSYLAPNSDEIRRTRVELQQLQRNLDQLPAIQNELVRRIRDQQIQQRVLEFLASELEQARIREQRDTPTVQVLDLPTVPERHATPKHGTTTVVTLLVSLVVTSMWYAFPRRGAPAESAGG